ncbi:MAG: hypothetical protein FWB79_04465 [Treponema sp.]|nr:hypothetical protein [Treponema sp.]
MKLRRLLFAAVAVAMAIALAGCPNRTGDDNGLEVDQVATPPSTAGFEVLFNWSTDPRTQALVPGTTTGLAAIGVIPGTPDDDHTFGISAPGWDADLLTIGIVEIANQRSLEFTVTAGSGDGWGAGIELVSDEFEGFQVGDRIFVSGALLALGTPAWDAPPELWLGIDSVSPTRRDLDQRRSVGSFEFDEALTAADIASLLGTGFEGAPVEGIRLGARAVGTTTVRVDHIIVMRPSDACTCGVPGCPATDCTCDAGDCECDCDYDPPCCSDDYDCINCQCEPIVTKTLGSFITLQGISPAPAWLNYTATVGDDFAGGSSDIGPLHSNEWNNDPVIGGWVAHNDALSLRVSGVYNWHGLQIDMGIFEADDVVTVTGRLPATASGAMYLEAYGLDPTVYLAQENVSGVTFELSATITAAALGADTLRVQVQSGTIPHFYIDNITIARPGGIQTIFSLATDAQIQGQTPGSFDITTLAPFSDAGTPVFAAVASPVTSQNISIQMIVNAGADQGWGQGLDLEHAHFEFEVGDRIIVAGDITQWGGTPAWGGTPHVFLGAAGFSGDGGVELERVEAGGPFLFDVTLTQPQVQAIIEATGDNPNAIRLGVRMEGLTEIRIDTITVQR